MIRRMRHALRIWICVGCLLLVGGQMAGGAEADSVQSRQKELARLKGEIDANRKQIAALKSKERDLSKHSERLRRDEDLTRKYLAELSAQDNALRADLASRQADYLDMHLQTEGAADRLRERLRRYHRARHVYTPELLFSSRSFNELFARAAHLGRMIQKDRLDLLALGQAREKIGREATVLDSRRRGLELLAEEKRREEERLAQKARETQAKLQDVKEERQHHEARVKELERAEAAIRKMLARLAEQQKAKKKSGLATGPGLEPNRGRLSWPVEGKLLASFGFEVHPIYKTRTPMNGIAIAAEIGTPITAVAAGKVEYVDWLPGYGSTVILDHGGEYYTIYAHTSEVMVTRGAAVTAGQVIAKVGDTDSTRGPCLHFEVRHGEQALNPKDWLR
ncbi:MAG: peptidoglycan DD-metalloendopeptidase family protein [Candidatus Eisenbacteria bacterium]|nr:peptidoglycan DD-metalloendopeptidase family protein [Candidatus Eisenbacteria bacterium]